MYGEEYEEEVPTTDDVEQKKKQQEEHRRVLEQQLEQQLQLWQDASAEHLARWRKGESLAPVVKHPHPSSLEDAKMKCLQRHNQLRARHNAPPIEWSDDLAKAAHVVAKQNNDRLHSRAQTTEIETLRGNGQNVYLGSSQDISFADAIDDWYAEIDDYNFDWLVKVQRCLLHMMDEQPPDFDFAGHPAHVGQFSQTISKNAKYVGMAKAGQYIVAKYDPPDKPSDEFLNVATISAEGKAEALAEGVRPPSQPKKALLKKDAVQHYVHRHSMSLQEKMVKELFNKADRNKDGVLSHDELQDVMEKLGMQRKDTKRLIAAADLNGDGVLCVDEFLTWLFSQNKTAEMARQYATG